MKTRILLVILALASASIAQAAHSQTLLDKVAAVTSPQTTDTTLGHFHGRLIGALIDQGEPVPYWSMDIGAFTPVDQVHFYFLARMVTLGWLRPLLEDRYPYSCDETRLRLQSLLVSGIEYFTWCRKEQWDAAHWLLTLVNERNLDSNTELMQKLFLLMHTSGIDLSPIEVRAAIEGTRGVSPRFRLTVSGSPYLSEHIHNDMDLSTPYESWNPWTETSSDELIHRPLVYFWDQHLHNNVRFLSRIEDIRGGFTYADIYEAGNTQYYIGHRLAVEGIFGLRTSPVPNESEHIYSGLKLLVNELYLDRSVSPLSFGQINMTDIVEPPILNFAIRPGVNNNPVIIARNITLGPRILDAPERLWSWIAETLGLSYPLNCPFTDHLIAFSLKQISSDNPYVKQYYDGRKRTNCIRSLLRTWKKILSYEMSRRPEHILHRYVSISTPGGGDFHGAGFVAQVFAVHLKKKVAGQIYVRPSTELAISLFGQEALENWGVAADVYLSGEMIRAEASGDNMALGRAIRDRLFLRRMLFTPITSRTGSYWTRSNEALQHRAQALGTDFRVADADRWRNLVDLDYPQLVGTEGTLELWSIPDVIRIIQSQWSSQSRSTFFQLWKVDRTDDSTDDQAKMYVGFEAQLATSKQILPRFQEAIEKRGYLYMGHVPDVERLEIRPHQSMHFALESVVSKPDDMILVFLSTDSTSLPMLLMELSRKEGLSATIGWSLDPSADKGETLDQSGVLLRIAGQPGECHADRCFVHRADNAQMEKIVFVNQTREGERRDTIGAVVDFDIEDSDGKLLYERLRVRFGQKGAPGHRRYVRLMMPEEFRIVYRVQWLGSDGAVVVDEERFTNRHRVYIR